MCVLVDFHHKLDGGLCSITKQDYAVFAAGGGIDAALAAPAFEAPALALGAAELVDAPGIGGIEPLPAGLLPAPGDAGATGEALGVGVAPAEDDDDDDVEAGIGGDPCRF